MTDLAMTLAERGRTHGSWEDNARRYMAMVRVMADAEMSDTARAALHMVFMKASRVASNGGTNPDDFHDMAGYSTLAERDILAKLRNPSDAGYPPPMAAAEQRFEKSGRPAGVGVDGRPTHADHAWNRTK